MTPSRRTHRLLAAFSVLAFFAPACSTAADDPRTVTLVTHDSFAVSKPVLRAFTEETGLTVKVVQNGDAGAALNQAILTKGAPLGDVLFGVDNTFLTRALDQDLFTKYRPDGLDQVPESLRLDPTGHATPIDFGDVCVNADREYFADRSESPPRSLDDLADPKYRDLLVVENPATSSPGLAFVAATVANYGDAWLGYWDRLRANGVLVVDGWETAYNGEFSGAGGGDGTRPLVVSYASSPAAEMFFADPPPDVPPTSNLDTTCFRQVEFAGVLRGASNLAGARKLVDFMLTRRFQEDVPLNMFVYPAVGDTPLPPVFTKYAMAPAAPSQLSPAEIGRHRDEWIKAWTDRMLR